MTDAEERERIIRLNPLEAYLSKRGHQMVQQGRELACKCPFHEDRSPSLSINVEKQVWTCRAGCGGGDIFDLVEKLDGLSFKDALEALGGRPLNGNNHSPPRPRAQPAKPAPPPVAQEAPKKALGKLIATYDYTDDAGKLIYQVCRFDPKDFRQRRPDGNGGWIRSLGDIQTTIYKREEIAKNPQEIIWVVEGEKDAQTVCGFGFIATTNSGGAGKWADRHSQVLAGREVILCGDNGEPGVAHIDQVEKSLAGVAKSTRRIKVPAQFKDITEYVEKASNPGEAMLQLVKQAEKAEELFNGVPLPIRSMAEISSSYRDFVRQSDTKAVRLGNWLPSLSAIRPIVPGEMVTILAGTGVGKTAILQNIAMTVHPLYTLFFELELPETLTFERFVSIASRVSGGDVWKRFAAGSDSALSWETNGPLQRIFTCDKAGLSVAAIRKYIGMAHLKLGHRPDCVMIDYFSLLSASGGSRYERMSTAAEEIKVMAKETNTVVICTSQVARKEKDSKSPEVFLHDAKDSGSIENSSGLVLGAWRDPSDDTLLHIKVLKSTKGGAGRRVTCRVHESLLIEEHAENPFK